MEIWKDIEGYEGRYQVSNLGNVRSRDYTISQITKYGTYCNELYKGRILKQALQGKYLVVGLYKDKKLKTFSVHRLVAKAFVPNPNNYPCVNHKDENKLNNCVDNLEWCTFEYNLNYGERNKKASEARLGHKVSKETRKKISLSNSGRCWFNNGIINTVANECPEGFVRGRIKNK